MLFGEQKHKIAWLGIGVLAGLLITTLPAHSETTRPLAGLSQTQIAAFEAGLEEFERRFRKQDGLGPQFNGNSCHFCHRKPSPGGIGPRYRSNFLFSNGDDLLKNEGGPLLQEKALRGEPKELIPLSASHFSQRKVAPLYGLGLIEAVPEEQLEALAYQNGGKIIRNEAGRIQRFGSQNHVASLQEFVEDGFTLELGITEDENASIVESINKVLTFIRFLAPPDRGEITAKVQRGEQIFHDIGCATCHTPTLTTAPGPFTTPDGHEIDVPALQGQEIKLYSDLLLHSLGPEVDDGVSLHGGPSAEYRTPPLWGLRFRNGKFMHDTRAANVDQMLLYHGGEAAGARDAAMALSNSDRSALHKFLRSL